ncbi:MAG: 2-oxoacid:acceptor oxidoreductase subunit alpha [Chloroflexi bacterium]|nr:2-oxoacid:acceptor oxidoreductase subunit alpha [Chloroflexota bacterium]
MTIVKTKTQKTPVGVKRVVNDFSFTIATMNGSGSQTSNLLLLRALFKMGIPVSGKNLFPSNIQGLPTWYTIRVSKDGYIARRDETEIVVALNKDTFVEDLEKVVPGGAFYYADHLKFNIQRDDITMYPMPVLKLVKESGAPTALRDYVANMVYVGSLAGMMGIDMDKIKLALEFHFGGRQKPIDLNFGLIQAAAEWAVDNLEKQDPFYVEPMDATDGLILADGNTSAALGSIYGGVQFLSWYPITPASSLPEALIHNISDLRDDPETGEKNYAIIQAEDELAAIGMAVGAGWSGLRAITSTSGPGISLMTEFIGLAYFAEVPVVIWDVIRVGPSTGLPTRTSQGDLTMVNFLGHGDTQQIILLPGTANECFEFGWRAFDIAERHQTPVFVLSDLDLGMNQWMSEPFEYPDEPMDRGKIHWEGDMEKLQEKWGRYKDVDGDGIPYRTVIGNRHAASSWFARGTGHDEFAVYSEDSQVWEENMARLIRKYETARKSMPEPISENMRGAVIGILAFGSTAAAIDEARDYLKEAGIKTNSMRVRAIPFTAEVKQFLKKYDVVYVVELNRDGQMHQLLTLEYPEFAGKMVSLPKHDGMPLSASWVKEAVMAEEQK